MDTLFSNVIRDLLQLYIPVIELVTIIQKARIQIHISLSNERLLSLRSVGVK